MNIKLHSEYQPTGDHPQAIKELVDGFKKSNQFQTLLGVTEVIWVPKFVGIL